MNEFVQSVFGLILRIGLLVAGLVFFLSLLAAASLLLMVWLLRALWARLTGRPVQAWAFRFDRQAMWQRFYRQAGQGTRRSTGPANRSASDDVIDVEPKEIKPPPS